LLTALCLALAALPLWRMTHSRPVPVVGIPDATATETAVTVPFQLQLSAAARRVVLRDEADTVLWESSAAVDGMVEATWPRLPRNVQLQVDWVTPGAPRYFAKLRLDPPGRETQTHVFDASSDLDDLWELP
jgi:hypothetical protein